MLKLTLLELFLRGVPEGFLIILAGYVFSKTVINKKRYIISSIIYVIAVYLIRLLPIQYGVHTILSIIVIIVLSVNINKISIIKSMQACIMAMILMFVCEGINMIIIEYIFKADIVHILSEPSLKILYAIPSLLILAAIIATYYLCVARKKFLSEVINGKIS